MTGGVHGTPPGDRSIGQPVPPEISPIEFESLSELAKRTLDQVVPLKKDETRKTRLARSTAKITETTERGLAAAAAGLQSDVAKIVLEKVFIGAGEVAQALDIGASIARKVAGKEELVRLQAEIESKQAQVAELKNTLDQANVSSSSRAELESQLKQRLHELKALRAQVVLVTGLDSEAAKDLIATSLRASAKASTGGLQIAADVAKGGSPAAASLGVAAGGAAGIASLLIVAFTSKQILKNRRLAETLEQQILLTQAALDRAISSGNEMRQDLLELRLQSLTQQAEENRANAIENVIRVTGAALGTAVPAKTIAIAAGVTLGAVLGTAATATGVTAVVAGTASMCVGAGYLVHKHHFTLENALKNVTYDLKDGMDHQRFKYLTAERLELKALLNTSERTYSRLLKECGDDEELADYIMRKLKAVCNTVGDAVSIEEAIEELEIKREELESLRELELLTGLSLIERFNPWSTIHMIGRQLEAINSREREIATMKVKLLETFGRAQEAEVRKINKAEQRLATNADAIYVIHRTQVERLEKRLIENQRYRYQKDLGKFKTSAEDRVFTAESLRALHGRIMEKLTADSEGAALEELQTFAAAYNPSLDLSQLDIKDAEFIWETIIAAATAPPLLESD